MGYSYKAILNKDNRSNKTGRHSIFIRVTIDRCSRYFNLGEKIDEKYWSGKENRWVKETYSCAFELNSIIRKKMDLLQKYEYRQRIQHMAKIAGHTQESTTKGILIYRQEILTPESRDFDFSKVDI